MVTYVRSSTSGLRYPRVPAHKEEISEVGGRKEAADLLLCCFRYYYGNNNAMGYKYIIAVAMKMRTCCC